MKKPPYIFTGLFALTAILYNSWPLGYFLDYSTARFGFASDLEDPHHPYAWLFIAGDIITALLLISISLFLNHNRPKLKLKYTWMALCIGLILFGFFTGFGAAAPDRCHGGVSVCVQVFNKSVSLDAAETSLASFGLVVVLFCSARLTKFLGNFYKLLSWSTFAAWFVVGSLLVHEILVYQSALFVQQVFLILCGVGLIILGLNLDKLYKRV